MPNIIETKFHGVSPMEYLKRELDLSSEDIVKMDYSLLIRLLQDVEKEQSTLFAEAWKR